MSGERPDVLDRLNAAAAAIESLNALVVADRSLDDVLRGVATYAVNALPGADAVSITVLVKPLQTVAHTDDDVRRWIASNMPQNRDRAWRPRRRAGRCALRYGPPRTGGHNSSQPPARPVCTPPCRFP